MFVRSFSHFLFLRHRIMLNFFLKTNFTNLLPRSEMKMFLVIMMRIIMMILSTLSCVDPIERCANEDRRILNELNHRRYDCVHHTGTEHTLTERHTHVHTHTKNPSFFSFALFRLALFALSFSLSSLLSFLVSFSFINERISLTPAFDVPLVAHLRS